MLHVLLELVTMVGIGTVGVFLGRTRVPNKIEPVKRNSCASIATGSYYSNPPRCLALADPDCQGENCIAHCRMHCGKRCQP